MKRIKNVFNVVGGNFSTPAVHEVRTRRKIAQRGRREGRGGEREEKVPEIRRWT